MVDMIRRELADFLEPEVGTQAAAELLACARLHPERDLRQLFGELGPTVATSDDELLSRFGRHLFPRLAALYPAVFEGLHTWRELLLHIAPRVHAELLSLQPDAEFPSLECRAMDGGAIEVEYRSPRNLAPMAQGMLLGCLGYFGASGSGIARGSPDARGPRLPSDRPGVFGVVAVNRASRNRRIRWRSLTTSVANQVCLGSASGVRTDQIGYRHADGRRGHVG